MVVDHSRYLFGVCDCLRNLVMILNFDHARQRGKSVRDTYLCRPDGFFFFSSYIENKLEENKAAASIYCTHMESN